MRSQLAETYSAATQRVRVISEAWAEENLYCAACDSDRLERLPHNTKSLDLLCGKCDSGYQLKSCQSPFGRRVIDGAYSAMRATILSGRTPNLLLLHYLASDWTVRDLMLIPSFAFSLSSVECRRPLAPTARRAGWIGCNIVLANIPPDARIEIVSEGAERHRAKVRREFDRLRPLERLAAAQKGWTLDVLNMVRRLDRQTFTLADVLQNADELRRLHPGNRHVEAKIRQQLQRLRDLGLLEFVDNRGTYRVKRAAGTAPSLT